MAFLSKITQRPRQIRHGGHQISATHTCSGLVTVNWTHCIALLLARPAPASSISWVIFTLARPTDCWIPPSLASPDLATEAGPDLWAAQDTVSSCLNSAEETLKLSMGRLGPTVGFKDLCE